MWLQGQCLFSRLLQLHHLIESETVHIHQGFIHNGSNLVHQCFDAAIVYNDIVNAYGEDDDRKDDGQYAQDEAGAILLGQL